MIYNLKSFTHSITQIEETIEEEVGEKKMNMAGERRCDHEAHPQSLTATKDKI